MNIKNYRGKTTLSLLACCTVLAVAYNLNGIWGLLEVAIRGAIAIGLLAVYRNIKQMKLEKLAMAVAFVILLIAGYYVSKYVIVMLQSFVKSFVESFLKSFPTNLVNVCQIAYRIVYPRGEGTLFSPKPPQKTLSCKNIVLFFHFEPCYIDILPWQ